MKILALLAMLPMCAIVSYASWKIFSTPAGLQVLAIAVVGTVSVFGFYWGGNKMGWW